MNFAQTRIYYMFIDPFQEKRKFNPFLNLIFFNIQKKRIFYISALSDIGAEEVHKKVQVVKQLR